jgi:hypothetical protein
MCEFDNASIILVTSVYMVVEAVTLAGGSYSSVIRYSSVSVACEMMVHHSSICPISIRCLHWLMNTQETFQVPTLVNRTSCCGFANHDAAGTF